jgi:hypothetical protein
VDGKAIWRGFFCALLMAAGKLVVGLMVPAWDFVSSHRRKRGNSEATIRGNAGNWAPTTLLGAAMVARGEIDLLVIQIGLSKTLFLARKAFVVGTWAILLNTIIGPVMICNFLRRVGASVATYPFCGVQPKQHSDTDGNRTPKRSRPQPGQVRAQPWLNVREALDPTSGLRHAPLPTGIDMLPLCG